MGDSGFSNSWRLGEVERDLQVAVETLKRIAFDSENILFLSPQHEANHYSMQAWNALYELGVISDPSVAQKQR